METVLKISQQTIWQVIGKVATVFSTLIIIRLITQNYGVDATGIYTLTLTTLSFLYLLVDFGVNPHIISTFQKDNYSKEGQQLLGSRMFLGLVLITLSVIILTIWPGEENGFRRSILITLPAVFGYGIYITMSAIFQFNQRYDLIIKPIILGVLLNLGLTYLLIKNQADLPNLLVAPMIGWLVCGVWGLILSRQYIKLNPLFDFSYIKNTFTQTWPLSLTLILNLIYFRLDSYILSAFQPFSQVGIYNLAMMIFQSVLVIPTFIMNSLYPIMLSDFHYQRQQFTNKIIKICLVFISLGVGAIIATYILSPLMILALTGAETQGSVVALRILSLSFPAFFLSSVLMWTIIVFKKYKQMMLVYLIGLTINLVLNIIFIPHYSYLASSVNTVISEYLILIMQLVILKPLLYPKEK